MAHNCIIQSQTELHIFAPYLTYHSVVPLPHINRGKQRGELRKCFWWRKSKNWRGGGGGKGGCCLVWVFVLFAFGFVCLLVLEWGYNANFVTTAALQYYVWIHLYSHTHPPSPPPPRLCGDTQYRAELVPNRYKLAIINFKVPEIATFKMYIWKLH